MSDYDPYDGIPTGSVPRSIGLVEDKSKIIPMMEPSLTIGNIQFNPNQISPPYQIGDAIFGPIIGPGRTPPFTTTPMPQSPNIIMTPELQKQIRDLHEKQETKKHAHYFKDVSKLKTIDVYRVLDLFGVTNQTLGHAIKKLLVAGGRGAGKSIEIDIQEAIDTLLRYQEIQKENNV